MVSLEQACEVRIATALQQRCCSFGAALEKAHDGRLSYYIDFRSLIELSLPSDHRILHTKQLKHIASNNHLWLLRRYKFAIVVAII